MLEFQTKIFVMLGTALVLIVIFGWPYLAKIPKKCRSCGRRAVVAYHKKPTGHIITSNMDNGHGGSGANTSYIVTFKCRNCGEERCEQITA